MKTSDTTIVALLLVALVGGSIFVWYAMRSPSQPTVSGPTLTTTSSHPQRLPDNKSPAEETSSTPPTPQRNLTNELGTTIQSFLAQRAGTGDLDQQTASALLSQSSDDLMRQFVTQLEQGIDGETSPFAVTITDNDVTLSNDDSPAAQHHYLVKIAALTFKYFNGAQHPLVTIGNAVQTKNAQKLDETVARFQNAQRDLMALPAPPSWHEFHKDLLRVLKQEERIFATIRSHQTATSDPATTLLALQKQVEISETINTLIRHGNNGLRAFGIIE